MVDWTALPWTVGARCAGRRAPGSVPPPHDPPRPASMEDAPRGSIASAGSAHRRVPAGAATSTRSAADRAANRARSACVTGTRWSTPAERLHATRSAIATVWVAVPCHRAARHAAWPARQHPGRTRFASPACAAPQPTVRPHGTACSPPSSVTAPTARPIRGAHRPLIASAATALRSQATRSGSAPDTRYASQVKPRARPESPTQRAPTGAVRPCDSRVCASGGAR